MQATFDTRGASVLVAISNFYTRAIVLNILRGASRARVRVAESAEEAMEVLRASPMDVLVLEWEPTGIDALLFTRAVRSGSVGMDRALPIIVVTSLSSMADVEAARQAGVTEYALKPLSAATLLSRVELVRRNPRPFVMSGLYVGPCRRRRLITDYRGPLRRLDDSMKEELSDVVQSEQRERLRTAIGRVADAARGLSLFDRDTLSGLQFAAAEAAKTAERLRDIPLAGAATSLQRYLAALDRTQPFDPEIIDLHVGALLQLVALTASERAVRERVAHDLARAAEVRLNRAWVVA